MTERSLTITTDHDLLVGIPWGHRDYVVRDDPSRCPSCVSISVTNGVMSTDRVVGASIVSGRIGGMGVALSVMISFRESSSLELRRVARFACHRRVDAAAPVVAEPRKSATRQCLLSLPMLWTA